MAREAVSAGEGLIVDAATSHDAARGHSTRDRPRDGCTIHGLVRVSVGGLRPRGEALPSLQDDDQARRSSRAFDVFLSALPAGSGLNRSNTNNTNPTDGGDASSLNAGSRAYSNEICGLVAGRHLRRTGLIRAFPYNSRQGRWGVRDTAR